MLLFEQIKVFIPLYVYIRHLFTDLFFIQYLCSNVQISHFYCLRWLHVPLFALPSCGGRDKNLW